MEFELNFTTKLSITFKIHYYFSSISQSVWHCFHYNFVQVTCWHLSQWSDFQKAWKTWFWNETKFHFFLRQRRWPCFCHF